MKLIIAIVVTATAGVVADTYTDRYDKMNVDEVLDNKRLMAGYVKCMMEQGRCTPEGKELKSHIEDALQNGCSKCTDTQRQSIRKVIKHLTINELESWKQLVDKYDPDGVYSKKYENELKSIQ